MILNFFILPVSSCSCRWTCRGAGWGCDWGLQGGAAAPTWGRLGIQEGSTPEGAPVWLFKKKKRVFFYIVLFLIKMMIVSNQSLCQDFFGGCVTHNVSHTLRTMAHNPQQLHTPKNTKCINIYYRFLRVFSRRCAKDCAAWRCFKPFFRESKRIGGAIKKKRRKALKRKNYFSFFCFFFFCGLLRT